MRITPLDVRKQEFRRAMRGLDPDEVYAFLATVAEEYEAVLNDNKALRERLLELDDKVQEYRAMEKTLRDTLLTAERVTVEAKDNARREASIIVKEAQIEAEKALRDIKNESIKLRQEVSYLRSQRDAYLAKMKLVAESHLDFIKTALDDFSDDDARVEERVPERETPRSEPEPQNMFAPESQPAKPTRPVSQPKAPEQADTVPIPGTPSPGTSDENARASQAPAGSPTTTDAGTPRAEATASPAADAGLADISAIIERMRADQRDTVSETRPAEGSWKQIVDEGSTQTAVATPEPAPNRDDRPTPPPAENDVTSELSLEEIRRKIGSGATLDRDS